MIDRSDRRQSQNKWARRNINKRQKAWTRSLYWTESGMTAWCNFLLRAVVHSPIKRGDLGIQWEVYFQDYITGRRVVVANGESFGSAKQAMAECDEFVADLGAFVRRKP